MKFKFSANVTIIGLILISLMLLASHWQWRRHLKKQDLIKLLNQRLQSDILPYRDLLNSKSDPEQFIHRRVAISGTFDFENEMILRNRRHNDIPGVLLLTPLKLKNTEQYILVSRGFIPLKDSEINFRKKYNINSEVSFIGLLKEPKKPYFFAPKDPDPSKINTWVDAWLRVDFEKMQKQLPYTFLPLYTEIMYTDQNHTIDQVVKSDSSKADILSLPLRGLKEVKTTNETYPVLVYDTVVPAGRHLGYVFEWASMALMTFLICLVLQFKRN